MKKYMLLFLLLAFLSGCAAAPQETPTPTEMPPPTIEATPEPTPEVIPTPELTPAPELELDLEPWQAAYVEIMREELTKLNTSQTREGYYLYDIDKNGIPELLFCYEDFSIPETWHIYTYCPYQSKNAVFLGEFSLSKEEWWTYPEGNGLLKYWVVKGAREVTLYTLENNTMKETQVFPDTVPQPDDLMEVLFPRAETIPGQGLRTDLNEVEDYSLLLAYPAANIYGTRGEAVELSRADFSVYDHVLSHEEQETLEGFLPVLTGKEPLIPDWKDGERILLTDWFKELLGDETGDFPSVFNAFALCDLDGDGAQELILWIDWYGGCYTILHREKGTVYGTYMSVRQFQELQTDGVYADTGGMGDRSYQQAYFENGRLLDKDLGHTHYYREDELVHYFIGEREVSEAEFEAWLKETMVGDVVWYAAREKKEVTP